jgi:arylsulfatase A-like enzyme
MATRPNVLFVMTDQHLATCLGAEGHPQAITPHMDALAAEGVRFRHAYCQNPICTPSRMSILSGQYCHNHGYYGLGGPTPTRLPTFLGKFKSAGYRTAAMGKLHLPDNPLPWAAGDCDVFLECMTTPRTHPTANPYYAYLNGRGLLGKSDHERMPELPGGQQHEARPSTLAFEDSVEGFTTSEAIRFIDTSREMGRPFCMEVSYFRPHQCYTPAQQFWDMYPEDLALPPTLALDAAHRAPHFRAMVESYRQMQGLIEPKGFEHLARRVWRGYLGALTHCDHALGLLITHLRRIGELDNTIIVYGADHGAYSGTHGIPEKAPGICSEAVCRVPFIWRYPKAIKAGHVSTALVENIDIGPTVMSLCGLGAMSSADGKDLSPLLAGATTPLRKVAVTENPWSKSVRFGPWRFVHYQPEIFAPEDVGELYHIESDPDETRNLYHDPQHAGVVNEARRLLLEWLIGTTRNVTAWIAPKYQPEIEYALAEDGKEAGESGLRARLAMTNPHGRNYL